MVAGMGRARRDRVEGEAAIRSRGREALASLWAAKWELAMPALVLVVDVQRPGDGGRSARR